MVSEFQQAVDQVVGRSLRDRSFNTLLHLDPRRAVGLLTPPISPELIDQVVEAVRLLGPQAIDEKEVVGSYDGMIRAR